MTWTVMTMIEDLQKKYGISEEDVRDFQLNLDNIRPGSLLTPTCAVVERLNLNDWRYLSGDIELYQIANPSPELLGLVAYHYNEINYDYRQEQFEEAFSTAMIFSRRFGEELSHSMVLEMDKGRND